MRSQPPSVSSITHERRHTDEDRPARETRLAERDRRHHRLGLRRPSAGRGVREGWAARDRLRREQAPGRRVEEGPVPRAGRRRGGRGRHGEVRPVHPDDRRVDARRGGRDLDPDMSYVIAAAEAIGRHAHPGMVIVLESTTYPGTTREVLLPLLTERGLVVGRDVFLAFSPERVDPGNPVYQTTNTPKVVGGITPACTEVATALYSICIQSIVEVSSPEAAELVKLLENTFRSVNIGLVNEMAIVCDKLGVDVWEVIDAAATKPFGFMKFTPGPGIGGHCIPLDPHYLAWKMR